MNGVNLSTTHTMKKIGFLKQFVIWVKTRHSINHNNGRLSEETFQATLQSTSTLLDVIKYSFEQYAPKYNLVGKFTTEKLEKRFGDYRFLSGCNYNVSCAKKKIKLKRVFQTVHNHRFSLFKNLCNLFQHCRWL